MIKSKRKFGYIVMDGMLRLQPHIGVYAWNFYFTIKLNTKFRWKMLFLCREIRREFERLSILFSFKRELVLHSYCCDTGKFTHSYGVVCGPRAWYETRRKAQIEMNRFADGPTTLHAYKVQA